MRMKTCNIQQLVRPNIAALSPYSSARDEFSEAKSNMIFLDANENPFETNVNRYPDPQQREVKSVLAALKGVATENMLLGNGSDEVLDLLLRAFCEPAVDSIITLPPTYGMYKVLAGVNNVEHREVLLTPDFEPDVIEILKTQSLTSKILFLCSPNNPTGNSFSKERIEKLLTSFRGLVVIDEAYIDFADQESWLRRLKEFPNMVIIQTLSKAYGMAGVRLGICYASSAIIDILNKIKPPYNVNILTQQKVLDGLTDTTIYENQKLLILSEKKALSKALLEVNWIKKVYPSQANFLLIKVDNAMKRYQQLLGLGIVVRNRTKQPLCENTLRITIGIKQENDVLIKTLKSIA